MPMNERGDILAIHVFAGKATLPESPPANRYFVKMSDLFSKLGVAATMPEQSAHTVADAILSRGLLLFGARRRLLTDQGANFESAREQNL